MVSYTDTHRLYLQALISRRIVTEKVARELYLKVAEQTQCDANPDDFENFIQVINKQLESLYIEIRQGKAEENGHNYYALVNHYEDEHSKLATDYTAQEIEFFKKVIETIVGFEEGSVSSTDLINIGHDLTKKVTAQAAEELLESLRKGNWLAEKKGKVSLGVRAVIELGQYLKKKFPDQIAECQLCQDIVISGDTCLNCGIKLHKYCAATAFHNLDANKRKCPSCKELWEHNLIKLPIDNNVGIRENRRLADSSLSNQTQNRRKRK